jgi:hypothetical protein
MIIVVVDVQLVVYFRYGPERVGTTFMPSLRLVVMFMVCAMSIGVHGKGCYVYPTNVAVLRNGGLVESGQSDVGDTVRFYILPGDTVLVEQTIAGDCFFIPSTVSFNGIQSILMRPWNGFRFTTPGVYVIGATGNTNSYDVYIEAIVVITEGVATPVTAQVLLDGPYDPDMGLMNDAFRSLPNFSYMWMGVFSPSVGVYPGSVPISTLSISGQDAVVHWVRLEWRSAIVPSLVVLAKYFLVQRDGDIIDELGSTQLNFILPEGDYYFAVRHVNHLGAMTAGTYHLDGTPFNVDLRDTSLALYGSDAMRSAYGTRLLWNGNAYAQSGGPQVVKYVGVDNDRDRVLQSIQGQVNAVLQVSSSSYREDLNMDGQLKYIGADNDRDVILRTIDPLVPVSVRVEQLPY